MSYELGQGERPEIKVRLAASAFAILNTLSTDEGISASAISAEVGLSESAVGKQITKLRGLGLVERHRGKNGGLLIYLAEKGRKFVEQISDVNPEVEIKSYELEVRKMASVKLQDDILEELETLMDEEELDSLTEATDFALSDYFGLLDEEPEEEPEELEER